MSSKKVAMLNPGNGLFSQDKGLSMAGSEQKRLQTMAALGLMDSESVPVFEEATQTAAHFLNAPICILGVMDQDRQWFKSAVGLSRIGLMNDLAASRQIARTESFCTHVVESRQVLAISDAIAHPTFANHLLVKRYGIQAYLGVPLVTANGECIGTLAVMELAPRNFTTHEIELLELIARWSMSEFERNTLLKQSTQQKCEEPTGAIASSIPGSVKAELITQMVQELRTPLTSILGMASVLSREIYGPLTDKQKEYMNIVHDSGQQLLATLNEIVELGALDDYTLTLHLAPVDIEMLCQQAFSTLEQSAQRREQQIRLTVEPGNHIWLLDKDKIRQMLYHLVFSIIQASSTESVIRIHISRKPDRLSITLWTSHPWLGEGLPQSELQSHQMSNSTAEQSFSSHSLSSTHPMLPVANLVQPLPQSPEALALKAESGDPKILLRKNLGLTLSRQLAAMHGGSIKIQGAPETGYRYVVIIPQMTQGSEIA